jgi:uncharacterized repeat protein (TIGR01451 family)
MKKTIAITCVGGLMGAALLSAAADEPGVNHSPRVRSLYFNASSDNAGDRPEWLTGQPSESDTPCECEELECEGAECDVVAAGGIMPPESESAVVVQAEEEFTAEAENDVTQVQGLRTLHPNEDRLTNPISTSSPAAAPSRFPAAPASVSQAAGDFSWAETSTAGREQPGENPFANQPVLHESASLPPAQAWADDSSPTAAPGRLTVTRGASASSRIEQSHASEAGRESRNPDVQLEWRSGGEINVGQETSCLLVVHNHGNADAERVEVTAVFPDSVRLLGAEPVPDLTEASTDHRSRLTWNIERLAPGSETALEVSLVPLSRGEIATEAEVRFSAQISGVFTVSEPMLDVAIEGPPSVMLGEPASHIVTISNPGTGVATQVQLEATIPEGLEHSRGTRLLMDLGSLNPGESRSVRLALAATRGGDHIVHVEARAEADLIRSASCQVSVVAPNLITTIEGPGLRYLGRQAVYTLNVVNDGSVPTDNVRVMHKLPEGFRFVSSDRGAQFDEANALVNWFVGRLDQSQSAQLQVTLEATQAGEFTHFIRATSENGAVSDAEVSTTVEATSSLALELRDIDDPVELSTEAAYEIVVRNEGTAAATNVAVGCELPAGIVCTSATGPSGHLIEAGAVRFESLAQLAAGESATFRVFVKAGVLGNHRLRAHVTSDASSEPLTDEEVTKFYGE